MHIRFSWNESKRRTNIKVHGLDFIDVANVFAGPTLTFEDDRFAYRERRFVTLGLLACIPVSIVYTEHDHDIHIVSFRKATAREAALLYANIGD